MSDETPEAKQRRTRTPNPYTKYGVIHAKAERARKAHAKAAELEAKAKAAAEKAAELAAVKEELEAEEQAAYRELQDALAALTGGEETRDDG
jgi:hypothetical protein